MSLIQPPSSSLLLAIGRPRPTKETPGLQTSDASTLRDEYSANATALRKIRGNKLWALSLALLKAQSTRAPGDLTPSVPLALPIQIQYGPGPGPGIGLLSGGTCFGEAESIRDYENWATIDSCAETYSREACLCVWILLIACVPELHSGYASANRVWGRELGRARPGLTSSQRMDLERSEAREYVRRYVAVEPFFRWFKSIGVAPQEISAVLSDNVTMRLAYKVDVAEGSEWPGGSRMVLVEVARTHMEFAAKLWEVIED